MAECGLCRAAVNCAKSQTSSMLYHLQNVHPGEYTEMLLKASQKVKAEVKVNTVVKVEEDFEVGEPEVKMEDNVENDEEWDAMGGSINDNDDKKEGKSTVVVDFETGVKEEGNHENGMGDANPSLQRSSPLWSYFSSVDKDLAKCSLCHVQVQCPMFSTSGMIRHLQIDHLSEYSQMLANTSQKVKEVGRASLDIAEFKKQVLC